MVDYSDLTPIEQMILDWRNENEIVIWLFIIASIVIIAVTFYLEFKDNRKKEQEEILEYRKMKREWIKRNGGL